MPRLEDTLQSLARRFAHDLVVALRGVELESLAEITHAVRVAVQVGKTPASASSGTSGAPAIARAIEDTVRAHGLSEREARVLTLAVRGQTRSAISRALGIPENTLKTQTRMLLRKFGVPSLSDAAIAVLHRALGSNAVVLRGNARKRSGRRARRR